MSCHEGVYSSLQMHLEHKVTSETFNKRVETEKSRANIVRLKNILFQFASVPSIIT